MNTKSLLFILCFSLSCFSCFPSLHAARKNPFSSQAEADCYLEKHYELGRNYYNNHEWRNASREFEKIVYFFPDSETAADSYYYLGVCFYERGEYDFANEAFTNHLKASGQPVFFEDALQYKFVIAEHFRQGHKKRPFLFSFFPKLACGKSLALTIYDDIVLALPNHDLAVEALFCKAQLLDDIREYRESIDTYQALIRRFPREEIVPQCYVNMAEVFCKLSLKEFQNPDILALAQLNAQRFQIEYPRDERVELAFGYVEKIKELYAKGLCDLGLFYERTGHPDASAIYFQSSIEEFPDTEVAKFCRYRLKELDKFQEEEALCLDSTPLDDSIEEGGSEDIETSDEEGTSTNISHDEMYRILSAHNDSILNSGMLICKRSVKLRYFLFETDGEQVQYQWEDIFCYPEFGEPQPNEEEAEEPAQEEFPLVHYSLLKKREVNKRFRTPCECAQE